MFIIDIISFTRYEMTCSTRFEKPMVISVLLKILRKQEIRVDCHARYTFTFIIGHL